MESLHGVVVWMYVCGRVRNQLLQREMLVPASAAGFCLRRLEIVSPRVERAPVRILVVVANFQTGALRAEVGRVPCEQRLDMG